MRAPIALLATFAVTAVVLLNVGAAAHAGPSSSRQARHPRPRGSLAFLTASGEIVRVRPLGLHGRIDRRAWRVVTRIFADPGPPRARRTISPRLIRTLVQLQRQLGGRPFVVAAGYQAPPATEQRGAPRTSYHHVARAADLRVPGLGLSDVFAACQSLARLGNRVGCGRYPDHVHLDVRATATSWRETSRESFRAGDVEREDDGPLLADVDERTALARILRSEVGSSTFPERVAIAWVARNRARARGTSIARMACTPRCGPGGKRPFSSRLHHRPEDLNLADRILARPWTSDPTRGATSAFEPALQDRLHAAGRRGYLLDGAGVRRKWLREHDHYGVVGRWELFGPMRRQAQRRKRP